MEKYRRVEKPQRNEQMKDVEPNEIRITQQGKVRSYISYSHSLFVEKHERCIVLKAMGNAISKAVTVAEILKHRVAKLHMVTRISSIETVDVYDPLEEGLDRIETKRKIPSIAIQLSLDELDRDDPGYQSPIPAEQVTEGAPYHDTREFRKARGHSRRLGRNNGRSGDAKGAAEAEEMGEAEEEDDDQTPSEDEVLNSTPNTRGKRGKGRSRGRSGNTRGRDKKPEGKALDEERHDHAVASSATEQQVESEIPHSVSTSRKSGRGRKGEKAISNDDDAKQVGEGEEDDEAREDGQANGRGPRGRHFGRGRGRSRGRGRGRGRRGESSRRNGEDGSLAITSSEAAATTGQ